MRLLFTALACLIIVSVSGQDAFSIAKISLKDAKEKIKPEEKIKYYDKNWIEVTDLDKIIKKAKYYRIYEPIEPNGSLLYFNIRDYDKYGSIKKRYEYACVLEQDDQKSVFCGVQVNYSQDGATKTITPYFNYRNSEEVKKYLETTSIKYLEGVWRFNFDPNKKDTDVLFWYNKSDNQYDIFEIASGLKVSSLKPTSDFARHLFEHVFINESGEPEVVDCEYKTDPYSGESSITVKRPPDPRSEGEDREWTFSKLYPLTNNPIKDYKIEENNTKTNNIRIRVSDIDIDIMKVAVIGKKSTLCNGNNDNGNDLAEIVEGELLGIYGVVERKYLEQILDEQRLAMSGLLLDDTDFAQAGCLAGAQGTVLTSYGCIQNKTKIQIKLVDCSTSDLYWSATGVDVSEFDLLDALRMELSK